jgi:predicted ATPase/DNA-binding winged helix-turn-helix (wHTH) protein
MDGASHPSGVLEFGRYRLDRHRREFLADGRPVELGGRAFDTLVALVDGRGTVLSKDWLLRSIWPDRVVEENNLEIQISTLRKVLGADRHLIRTVVGRGYQFTGDVRGPGSAVVGAPVPIRATNLPAPVSELIGREAEIREVLSLVTAHRLVTLTGAGGIGKTRLGLEIARRLLPTFLDGVYLTDLAPISDGALVSVTAAAALNLTLVAAAVSPEGIASAISTKRLLLVLDNCEHLVDPSARMVQALLRGSPGVSLLVTSREPLRVEGEYVYRVPPLAMPPEGTGEDEDMFRYDAVRLFLTRAQAAEPRFTPGAPIALAVAAISRRLDGIPLAIELAAACVPAFGVDGIAARLDDRFTLLTSGNRTALPRHQTLRATLDWSCELLTEHERVVLRRLAVFAGTFALEAASTVAAGGEVSAGGVEHALAGLVTRSLVSANVSGAVPYFRLLETTRAYALARLRESGEFDALARRHAEYQCTLCERIGLQWGTSPRVDWLAVYGHQLDNVRLALDWALSPSGDAGIGMTLAVAAVPLWLHLSLVTECRARVEQAIAHRAPQVPSDPRRDMQLFLALGHTFLNSRDIGSPEMNVALTKALELAEDLDDTEYRLAAMFGLYAYRINTGDYRGALALAETFRSVAAKTTDPSDALVGARLIGVALHILGDQPGARRLFEPLVGADFTTTRRSHIIRYQFDQRVTIHCYYARILWLQGFADQAMQVADSIVDYAQTEEHLLSLLYALISGAAIALCAGNVTTVDHHVRLAFDLSAKHGLETWNAWAQCFVGVLVIRRRDSRAGSRLLRAALEVLPEPVFHHYMSIFLAELAAGLGGAGQIADGLVAIDKALSRAERTEERWFFPELLRTKGELLLLQGAPVAEEWLEQAFDWAGRQGALSLQLRSAMSLARLHLRGGRITRARKLLAPVYRRFTEGFGTADLMTAKALLDTLR